MKKIVSIIILFLAFSLLTGCDFYDHQFYLRKYHEFTSIEDLSDKVNQYQDDVPLFKFSIIEDDNYENIQLYEHRDKIFWSYSYTSTNPKLGYNFSTLLESEKSLSMEVDNFGDVVVENEEIIDGIKFRYVISEPNAQNNRYVVNVTAYFVYHDVYYFLNIRYAYYQEDINGYEYVRDFIINSLKWLNKDIF